MIQASMFFETPGSTGGVKIPVGIQSGVSFEGAVQEPSFTDLNFGASDGRTIHKRVFNPTGSKPRENESVEQALERETKRSSGTITAVLYAVLGKEAADKIEGETFEQFRSNAVKALNSNKGAKVNLKVVPDWRERKFPDVPDYSRFDRFVEAHVPGQTPTLSFSPREQQNIDEMHANRANNQTDSGVKGGESNLV